MPMMTPFGTFTERGRLHWAHTHLRQLFAHGMLDGAPHDLLGRPKPYKIARCFDIEAHHPTSSDGPGLRVEVQHDDGGWPFPKKVNIVQYHGEPLAPLDLVRGFDILPPQVAVRRSKTRATSGFAMRPRRRTRNTMRRDSRVMLEHRSTPWPGTPPTLVYLGSTARASTSRHVASAESAEYRVKSTVDSSRLIAEVELVFS